MLPRQGTGPASQSTIAHEGVGTAFLTVEGHEVGRQDEGHLSLAHASARDEWQGHLSSTHFFRLAHLQALQLGPALLCLLDEVWCLFFIVLQLVRGRVGSLALTPLEPALL